MGCFVVSKKKKKRFLGCFGTILNIERGLNKIKGGMPPISPNQKFSAV